MAVVLLGKGIAVGLLADIDPLVVVMLVETVALVVVLDMVEEPLKVVSNGEVKPPRVNAFAEKLSAIGNIAIMKTMMPSIE
ncbi:MAG TPA: hypothetical protein VFX64_00665 [Candidatus Nitrosotalea sp.]|nr:hypothetical protein [Candidatus Nitrosotalea sp.]